MGITWLNTYIKNILKDTRNDFKQRGFAVWIYSTGAGGWISNDAYKRTSWEKSAYYFSGSIAWNKSINRSDTQGGYYEKADATIIASMDNRSYFTGSGISTEVKITADNINLKLMQLIDAEDTNEIVLYCEKLENS